MPTVTLPKLRLLGLELRAPGVTADPESGTLIVEALERTVTLPLTVPAEVGLKATVKLADCPAPREKGRLMPLTLKPVPLAVTPETVTLDPPVFVTVSDNVLVVPTVTLPKLKLLGVAPSEPAARPEPDSGTVIVAAFEVIVMFPLAAPTAVGLNPTVKLAL